MQGITGDHEFRIFQDHEDVAWGQQWQSRINESIDGTLVLIPIMSPFFFRREACRDELTRFLDRESKLGRSDLILPIYFIDVPNFNANNTDELIATLSRRQFRDWRQFRHDDLGTPEARKRIATLAREMERALSREFTPQELALQRKRRAHHRLDEFQEKIGGPFRSSSCLQGFATRLQGAGIECLERLLNCTEDDLRSAGFSEQEILNIIDDLKRCGQELRGPNEDISWIDQLVLTPGCRNAVHQAGITNLTELTSMSRDELMATKHFLPSYVEEVSLRLLTELGAKLRN